MENIKENINVSFVPNLKSRQIKFGTEAQKKHEEILALIERTKKLQKQAETM